MQLFVEVRSTVQRSGKPVLVPIETVQNHTGFRSVYAYDETVANLITETGSTKGLRGVVVYSDTLFVDFDGQDSTAFRQLLIDRGIAFTQWDSGNRSDHYHITIEPMSGCDVPARQKAWIKEHAPTADISFYHPAGQYRLPRTYHYKTSKQKVCVASYLGKPLSIPELKTEERGLTIYAEEPSIENFYFQLLTQKGEGKRRPHLFVLAVSGFEIGMDFDEVMEHLRWWNERRTELPHDENALLQQCSGAAQYVARKYGKAG